MTFGEEVAAARARMAAGELEAAMGHLERAHVIGQRQVWPHVLSHWLMLKLELRRGRPGAAVGQLLRIVLGALGSALGVVPTGNTGGSDIGMFRRLPVAPDLQAAIDARPGPDPTGAAALAWAMLALLVYAGGAGLPLVPAALALAILLSTPRLLPRQRLMVCRLLALGLLAAALSLGAGLAAFCSAGLAARLFLEAGKK